MEIRIRKTPDHLKRDPKQVLAGKLGFGQVFCDRMFRARWSEEKGWHDAEIAAYEPIPLDPGALVFHYAQEIFEGLKAYRRPDGGIGMFRPVMNAERFNRSATRLVMPEVPVDDQMQAMTMLVKELQDWIPSGEGQALYLRPTMIASNPVLGVKPATEYLYFVIGSPVGAYFENGFSPVKVATSQEYVRAAVGGTGAAKCGGNYAASLLAAKIAKAQGYDQVVWLDAKEHRYIEEMGGMNIFFVYGDTLATCPLTGSILPGVTRNSILTLAADLGLKAEERMLDVDEVCRGIDAGEVTEVFACGTAAVVTAVGVFGHNGTDHRVGNGEPGQTTRRIYDTLTGIQTGKLGDKHGWCHRVD